MPLNSETFKLPMEVPASTATPGEWTKQSLIDFAEKVADAAGVSTQVLDSDRFDGGFKIRFVPCPLCKTTGGKADLWLKTGHRCFNCFETHDPPNPRAVDLDKLLLMPKTIDILRWDELNRDYAEKPETIVEGLLRRGDTAGFIGATKSNKTWFIVNLAVCLALRQKWLNFNIAKPGCKVLIVDNELQKPDLRHRYLTVCEGLTVSADELDGKVFFLSLRGTLLELNELSKVIAQSTNGPFDVIILDSLYKFFPEKFSENDNAAMTKQLTYVDKLAREQNAAVIFTHHQSKGKQHEKATTDVGSGAGSLSRSTDLHLVIRFHEEGNKFVISAAARSQLPIDDFTVGWKYPLFSATNDQPFISDGKKVRLTMEQVLKQVPFEPVKLQTMIQRLRENLKCTEEHAKERLDKGVEDGSLVKPVRKKMTEPQMIYRASSTDTASTGEIADAECEFATSA
jgi:hypothetical protein